MKVLAMALVALVLGAIVSGYFLARAESLPTEGTSTNTVLVGQAKTAFTYNASLLPNTLFAKNPVGPDQGDLFPALVQSLDFGYGFSLQVSQSANVTIQPEVALIASTQAWNLTLNSTHPRALSEDQVAGAKFSGTMDLNLTAATSLFQKVQNETYYVPNVIDLELYETVLYTVSEGNLSLARVVSPVYVMALYPNLLEGGNRTFFANWTQNETSLVPDSTRSEYIPAAVGALAATVVGVAVVAFLLLRPRREWGSGAEDARSMEARLDAEVGPYRDAVAETMSLPHKENIVVMRDWMDIVRAADMLGKPILHLRNDAEGQVRHLFYVVDGAIQYVYLRSVEASDLPVSAVRRAPRKPAHSGRTLWERLRG
jgi:hypothetical protein